MGEKRKKAEQEQAEHGCTFENGAIGMGNLTERHDSHHGKRDEKTHRNHHERTHTAQADLHKEIGTSPCYGDQPQGNISLTLSPCNRMRGLRMHRAVPLSVLRLLRSTGLL